MHNNPYHFGVSLPLDALGETPINTNGSCRSTGGARSPPAACKMHLSLDVHQEHFINSHCRGGGGAGGARKRCVFLCALRNLDDDVTQRPTSFLGPICELCWGIISCLCHVLPGPTLYHSLYVSWTSYTAASPLGRKQAVDAASPWSPPESHAQILGINSRRKIRAGLVPCCSGLLFKILIVAKQTPRNCA